MLQQYCDQTGPSGLVRGADPAPGVSVEIFVEQQVIAERRVIAVALRVSENRPAPGLVLEEQPGQPARQFRSNR
jgi:hypothetical protein